MVQLRQHRELGQLGVLCALSTRAGGWMERSSAAPRLLTTAAHDSSSF